MNYLGYIVLTILYIIALLYIEKYYKKKTKYAPSDPSSGIIAIGNQIVVNVITETSDIDYSEFADVTYTLSDLLKHNSTPSPVIEKNNNSITIHFKEINFSTFLKINTI